MLLNHHNMLSNVALNCKLRPCGMEGKLDVHEDGSTLSGMELAAGTHEKLVQVGFNPF